jgi:nucleoside-diphosphate-sugar epimerase
VGGFQSSVLSVAEMLKEIRPETEIVRKPFPQERKAIEIGDYVSDHSAFSDRTGWEPKIGLKEGLLRTVEFYETSKGYYWQGADSRS